MVPSMRNDLDTPLVVSNGDIIEIQLKPLRRDAGVFISTNTNLSFMILVFLLKRRAKLNQGFPWIWPRCHDIKPVISIKSYCVKLVEILPSGHTSSRDRTADGKTFRQMSCS